MCVQLGTLDIALAASGSDSAKILHKPRLLSDYGSSYIAGDLAEYLEAVVRGATHARPPRTNRSFDGSKLRSSRHT